MNVSVIRTTELDTSTIVDVSLCLQVIAQDHVWLLGDDQSAIAVVAADLKILADIMTADIRDDTEIRQEATRLVRIVERRAVRDLALGLLVVDEADFLPLLRPDEHAATGEHEAASSARGQGGFQPIRTASRG